VSPFRVDRSRREEDRFLGQKMLFFVLGAIAGLAGMTTDTDWLIYLAVLLLSAGLVLRMLDSRRRVARRREEEIEAEEDALGEEARLDDTRDADALGDGALGDGARDEGARDEDARRAEARDEGARPDRSGRQLPGGAAD
jgi:hypothetical protein